MVIAMKPEVSIRDLSYNISNYCLSSCVNCTLGQSKHWKLDKEAEARRWYPKAFEWKDENQADDETLRGAVAPGFGE